VYVALSGLPVGAWGGGGFQPTPCWSDRASAAPIDHMPMPSSETSTVVASPVRSRWYSAPMIPPAMVMAPIESPNAGAGGAGT
jgi:hypothetical protein